jgi:hypothetical protein
LPAVILNASHCALVLDFFRENNPNNQDYSWVEEYFLDQEEEDILVVKY